VESLGEKLRSARESKGFNFDTVCRDTNIATRYLEAFEKEDFSVFPGESYLIGFLRNYGEYLGLNVRELLSLYQGIKIQEQEVPVERLLNSPSRLPRIFITILIVLVILAAIGGAVYFFMNIFRKPAAEAPEIRPAVNYVLEGSSLERRFYQGDTVLIPLEGEQYKLELTTLGEAVTISTPGGQVTLDLGMEENVDLDSNGTDDVRISAIEFMRNDPGSGVRLSFNLIDAPERFDEMDAVGDPAAAGIVTAAELTQTAPGAGAQVIFASSNAHPFTLHAVFQGYCMFRWQMLPERARQERNEQYYIRNEELNVETQNGVRIWASNAAAVKLEVIGGSRTVPLEIGGAGEVVVADLRWVRDDDGRFRLVLVRLD
jgi:cytoskeletal protein RodZ